MINVRKPDVLDPDEMRSDIFLHTRTEIRELYGVKAEASNDSGSFVSRFLM